MRRFLAIGVAALTAAALAAPPAHASHSWGNYHWAQASTTAPAVSVMLGNSLSRTSATNWPALFKGTASAPLGSPGTVVHDWTNLHLMPPGTGNAFGDILDTPWASGSNVSNPKRCKAVSGRVEVCNARYGFNGWLGVAQIWISGGHIVQGTTKVNDSYFNSSSYTAAGKQHVLCQEIGHAFGLDHQDESGADLDTCMDYANALDNPHPNAHDNEQINAIYRSHTDAVSASTLTTSANGNGKARRVEKDVYVEQLRGGGRIVTHVTWVNDRAAAAAPRDHVPE